MTSPISGSRARIISSSVSTKLNRRTNGASRAVGANDVILTDSVEHERASPATTDFVQAARDPTPYVRAMRPRFAFAAALAALLTPPIAWSATMSPIETNKAAVRRLYDECVNAGRTDGLADLIAP